MSHLFLRSKSVFALTDLLFAICVIAMFVGVLMPLRGGFRYSTASEPVMEPKFVDLPAFYVAGVQYYGGNPAGEIPALWPVFNSMNKDIKHKAEPAVYYGIETYPPNFMQEHKWFYTAAVGVTSLADLPVQLVGKQIPANRYAVFTHKGKLPGKIGETFMYIYTQWLPQSEYVPAGPYDFERYDDRTFFGPDNENSVVEIYVPVKKKG